MPVRLFPGFGRFDFKACSHYEVMETKYKVSISRARRSLEPVVAMGFEADLLGYPQAPP